MCVYIWFISIYYIKIHADKRSYLQKVPPGSADGTACSKGLIYKFHIDFKYFMASQLNLRTRCTPSLRVLWLNKAGRNFLQVTGQTQPDHSRSYFSKPWWPTNTVNSFSPFRLITHLFKQQVFEGCQQPAVPSQTWAEPVPPVTLGCPVGSQRLSFLIHYNFSGQLHRNIDNWTLLFFWKHIKQGKKVVFW